MLNGQISGLATSTTIVHSKSPLWDEVLTLILDPTAPTSFRDETHQAPPPPVPEKSFEHLMDHPGSNLLAYDT